VLEVGARFEGDVEILGLDGDVSDRTADSDHFTGDDLDLEAVVG
jgi:hypothetical protein